MKNNPLISIVIPIYNQRPAFLRECIESVLNQTYQNLEIILSDNHSTNEVPQIITEYAKLDSRIKIVKPESFLKLTPHFQFAAENVKGKYLSFLASDDWVYPDWLEKMIPQMEKYPNAAFGYGEIELADKDLKICNTYRNYKLLTGFYDAQTSFKRFLTLVNCGWMLGDIIRTDAYQKVGGIRHDPIIYSSDFSLVFKLHEIGGSFYLNEKVGINRSWGIEDGKIDANREIQSVVEFNEIYSILEKSNILKSYLESPEETINYWKSYHGKERLKGIIINRAKKNISIKEIESIQINLLALNDSKIIHLGLLIGKTPLVKLYFIYKWFKDLYYY